MRITSNAKCQRALVLALCLIVIVLRTVVVEADVEGVPYFIQVSVRGSRNDQTQWARFLVDISALCPVQCFQEGHKICPSYSPKVLFRGN